MFGKNCSKKHKKGTIITEEWLNDEKLPSRISWGSFIYKKNLSVMKAIRKKPYSPVLYLLYISQNKTKKEMTGIVYY